MNDSRRNRVDIGRLEDGEVEEENGGRTLPYIITRECPSVVDLLG